MQPHMLLEKKLQKANDKAYKEIAYTTSYMNLRLARSRAKSCMVLDQIEKGKRDDGMDKFNAQVYVLKDGKVH